MYTNLSIERLCLGLCLSVILFCVACQQDSAQPTTQHRPTVATNDSLLLALTLPGKDVAQTDSLVAKLTPILLSSPEDRIVENWYPLQESWIADYGTAESILFCADIAYQKFLQVKDHLKASQAQNAIGRIYAQIGDYAKAIEAQQIAYKLAQQERDSLMMGWCLSALGSSFVYSQDLETSKDYFERSKIIGESLNDPGLMATSKINFGVLWASEDRVDQLLPLMNKALEIAKANDLIAIQEVAQLNISYNYVVSKDYDKAIQFLLEYTKEFQSDPSIANTILFLNLYEAYAGKRAFVEAERYLQIACEMAHDLNYGYGKINCAEYRANLFAQQHDYQEAFDAFQDYHNIYKEQTGLDAARKLQALETKSRLQQKDWEIDKLNEAKLRSEAEYRLRFNQFLLALGSFILLISIIYVVIRTRHRAKIAEQQKTIAETKLQVLQSQMNPHFMFNALGGVQNYILKSEKIEAYSYVSKFAVLLRIIATYAASIHIELDQEIEFISTYLELEKLRFREEFDYVLLVDEELKEGNFLVPSMVIQPFIENAMIHGLAGLERKGELNIQLNGLEEGVECIITDNGRGRKAAGQISRNAGRKKHLSIASVNTQERLAFMRKLGYTNTRMKVEDLYQNGQPAGTKVTVYLPYIMAEELAVS